MNRLRRFGPVVLAGLALSAPPSASQTRERPAAPAPSPRPEPVAETKLLMEGLAKPNFDGLGRSLKGRPADAAAWGFARGQALLVAEAANLLMLRPPKGAQPRETWLARAAELREAGSKTARAAANKDYLAARAGRADVANSCNRCHEAFRVAVRVSPDDPAD